MANGALQKIPKGSMIPSRGEIVKDLVKWFAGEYGLDVAEALFAPLNTAKLIELWRNKQKQKKASGGSGGGGGVWVLVALIALGGKKRRRR